MHHLVQDSKSVHKETVLGELLKKFEKVRKLNVDLSNLPKPSFMSGAEHRPLKKRKSVSVVSSQAEDLSKLTPQQLLDKLANLGGRTPKLNLTPPPGAPSDCEGLFIETPEHGLLFHNSEGEVCFQRTAELPQADVIHLFTLNWICLNIKKTVVNTQS